MRFHIRLLITAATALLMMFILPGFHPVNFMCALGASLLLSLLITGTKRFFLKLRIPMNLIFFGFFHFVLILSSTLIIAAVYPGFFLSSFWYALLFTIIMTGITSVINSSIVPVDNSPY